MPTRNEVLMRSANLLNDFAFKYVFGEDCKEANDGECTCNECGG